MDSESLICLQEVLTRLSRSSMCIMTSLLSVDCLFSLDSCERKLLMEIIGVEGIITRKGFLTLSLNTLSHSLGWGYWIFQTTSYWCQLYWKSGKNILWSIVPLVPFPSIKTLFSRIKIIWLKSLKSSFIHSFPVFCHPSSIMGCWPFRLTSHMSPWNKMVVNSIWSLSDSRPLSLSIAPSFTCS